MKKGWKWRTEQFRKMSEDELKTFFKVFIPEWVNRPRGFLYRHALNWALGGSKSRLLKREYRRRSSKEREELLDWKRRHVSPKMARWIYETLLPDPHLFKDDPWLDLRRHLLWLIAINKWQPSWANSFFWREVEKNKSIRYGMWVVEAMSGLVGDIRDVPKFIALYDDEEACPEARGEALFGLAYLARSSDPRWLEVTHDVCLRALHDQKLPYARAGATWLAAWTLRFEDEILGLRNDQTLSIEGWSRTVASDAEVAYESLLDRRKYD